MAGRDENIPSIDRTLLLIAADLPDISLQDAAFGISKTAASVFLEAVGEYARLLYDLFPQALIMDGFTTCKFVPPGAETEEEGEVNPMLSFISSLTRALGVLAEGEEQRTTPLRTRVICLLSERPSPTDSAIYKSVQETLKRLPVSVACDLVLVVVRDKPTSKPAPPPRMVSPLLTVQRVDSTYPTLLSSFTSLAMQHFSLRAVRITGIPMKESSSSGPKESQDRSMYDVVVVHPASNHWLQEGQASAELTLQWRTMDKRLNPLAMACKCTHRVTTLNVYSNPAVCLMKHVHGAGKPVSLAPPPVAGDAPSTSFSHLMLQHGDDVWLHCLHPYLSVESVPIPALSVYTRQAPNYRTENFLSLVNANMLQPGAAKKDTRVTMPNYFKLVPSAQLLVTTIAAPASAQSQPQQSPKLAPAALSQLEAASPPFVSTKSIEKATRYYPLFESDTLLYAAEQSPTLRGLLDPVKAALLSSHNSTDEDAGLASELLSKLHQYAVQNETIVFPQLMSNYAARQEAYRRLWLEILTLARRCVKLAPLSTQGKIASAMERMWPELSGLPPPAPEPTVPKQEESAPAKEAEGEMSKRSMMELQMLRDREREREEEERRRGGSGLPSPGGGGDIKRERGPKPRGMGRHRDLDTPADEPFIAPMQIDAGSAPFASPDKKPRLEKEEEDRGKGGKKADGTLKLSLRRKKSQGGEQYARSLYGMYWNAAQQKRGPGKEFDGRLDEA